MRRRLLNLLTALSLLLCVAVMVLWARSYWHGDKGGWSRVWVTERAPSTRPTASWRGRGQWTTWRYATIETAPGVLEVDVGVQEFDFATMQMGEGGGFFWQVSDWPGHLLQPGERPWQLRYDVDRAPDSRHRMFTVTLPTWVLALAAAVAPAAWAVLRTRRARRHRFGSCPSCGYDLRATPGRCPECGTPATTPE